MNLYEFIKYEHSNIAGLLLFFSFGESLMGGL